MRPEGRGPDGAFDVPVDDYGRETDRLEDPYSRSPADHLGFPRVCIDYQYDPTNGLLSRGDIFRIKF